MERDMAYLRDYDDGELGDMPEEMEDDCICPSCNGSGEGMHEGTKCRDCGGSGGVRRDDDQGARADEAYERWRDAQDERERERA